MLAAAGYAVHREYYINDAGRQMDILASSLWLRYLETFGEPVVIPKNGYPAEYLKPVAAKLREVVGESLRRPAADVYKGLPPDEPEGGDKEVYVDAVIERVRQLIGQNAYAQVLEVALTELLADIRNDLEEFGVVFDQWYSERSLETNGAIARALAKLESQGQLYQQEGATWFRASAFGDEKDRVVVRENGQKTYFASDIAYHYDKRQRGFEKLVDVLGSGHHGYIARVKAGLAALGEPPESLDVPMIQIVMLLKGGEPVKMGKRTGNIVLLRELREEVGNDACRFFYLLRSHEQNLEFDLDLATKRASDNPVFYVQYAHARVASVLKEVGARGFAYDKVAGLDKLALLDKPTEQALDQGAVPVHRSRGAGRGELHAPLHRLLSAGRGERIPHLLPGREVARRRRGPAQRAPRARAGGRSGDPQRSRRCWACRLRRACKWRDLPPGCPPGTYKRTAPQVTLASSASGIWGSGCSQARS